MLSMSTLQEGFRLILFAIATIQLLKEQRLWDRSDPLNFIALTLDTLLVAKLQFKKRKALI